MDKFFIQNAFKTLDEIEAEMKQQKSLKEELKEPVVESMDLDELQTKYVGAGCVIKDPESQYVDDCGSIQSLIDFNGDFEKSVWKVVLDTGISLNVSGGQLSVDLEEKLPPDLAHAYRNTGGRDYNSNPVHLKRNYDPSANYPRDMGRGKATIDFANSNYKEISADEAIQNYFAKPLRHKLRCLINRKWGGPLVAQWDPAGNMMLLKSVLEPFINGSVNNFKDIINSASKIYVTDEDEHHITPKDHTQPLDPELRDLGRRAGSLISGKGSRTPEEDKISSLSYLIRDNNVVRDVEDTGMHRYNKYSNKQLFIDAENAYKKKLKQYKDGVHGVTEEDVKKALDYLKKRQQNYWDSNKQSRLDAKSFSQYVSESVARFILLKFLAKEAADNYEKTEQGNYGLISSHPYKQKMNALAGLEEKLKSIVSAIQELQDDLKDGELQRDYEEQLDNVLNASGEEYLKLVDQLNDLRAKHGLEVKESLEDAPKCKSCFRIYTVDENGVEDFVDDIPEIEEEALSKAKELADKYKKVCLVRVSTCNKNEDEDEDVVELLYDSDEDLTEAVEKKQTFGELIDSIIEKQQPTEESLKESKSFNIKDEKEITDAFAYKGVGEEQEDDLVVIDPSIESLEEEREPHVGDAILQCIACKTSFFEPSDKLKKDEDSDLYNKEMACPHCGAEDGFKYLYQVGKKEAVEQPEEDKETENENSELEPVEDDFVEIDDADNVKEESFEKLVNPYLTKLYENVDSFKTTAIYQPTRNTLKIEGKLIGKNGAEKLVEFLFTKKENKNKTLVLEGYNSLLTDNQKAYTLTAKLDNKDLVFESFSYNYNKEVNGENILIEGFEK